MFLFVHHCALVVPSVSSASCRIRWRDHQPPAPWTTGARGLLEQIQGFHTGWWF